jgi:hypothetical protein
MMFSARCWWLMPVIIATQEAEIRRITVQRQPWQIVPETLSRKHPSQLFCPLPPAPQGRPGCTALALSSRLLLGCLLPPATIMIIYRDLISHDELFSDIYKIREIADGLCLEVEGKDGQ